MNDKYPDGMIWYHDMVRRTIPVVESIANNGINAYSDFLRWKDELESEIVRQLGAKGGAPSDFGRCKDQVDELLHCVLGHAGARYYSVENAGVAASREQEWHKGLSVILDKYKQEKQQADAIAKETLDDIMSDKK